MNAVYFIFKMDRVARSGQKDDSMKTAFGATNFVGGGAGSLGGILRSSQRKETSYP